MKVAIVYHYFAHYREPVINELFSTACKNNSDLILLSDVEANEPNLNVLKFNDNNNFIKIENKWFGKFLWQKGLILKLIRNSPQTIIFLGQFNFISTWVAAVLFRLLGKRVIFWGHGVYGSEAGIKKIIRNCFNKLPHKYMTYGEHARNIMIQNGMKSSSISVIFNSLNVAEQNKLYHCHNSDEVSHMTSLGNETSRTKKINLIFVGRLTSVKKISLLLLALARLDKNNYHLNIVGSGPEENALKELSKRLQLADNVTFKGEIHDEIELSRLIYNSELCVSPGNVGLTAMHALIYGTPVITNDDFNTQMPEFEAIVPGVNGGFFAADDVVSLAETIEEWGQRLSSIGRDVIREDCRRPILQKYNPKHQAELIWRNVDSDV